MKETIIKTTAMNGHEVTIQTDNDGRKETFTYLWIGDHDHCVGIIDDKRELRRLHKMIGKILGDTK